MIPTSVAIYSPQREKVFQQRWHQKVVLVGNKTALLKKHNRITPIGLENCQVPPSSLIKFAAIRALFWVLFGLTKSLLNALARVALSFPGASLSLESGLTSVITRSLTPYRCRSEREIYCFMLLQHLCVRPPLMPYRGQIRTPLLVD